MAPEPTLAETWWTEIGVWGQSAVVVVGGLMGGIALRDLVLKPLERFAASTDNDVDDRLLHFVKRFWVLLLLFVIIVGVLNVHEVDISPLLAGAGIAGIALGLAAKETLMDVFAGIFLIVDRPLRIGDRVKIERIGSDWGSWGDVVDIRLRRTQVRNTDGVIIDYPNAFLAASVITNFTQEDTPVRVRTRFSVDYSADIQKARELAIATAHETEGVLDETAEVVTRELWNTSQGHQTAGVLLELRYRVEDIRERTRIRSRVLESLLRRLHEADIPLAAPTVQMRS